MQSSSVPPWGGNISCCRNVLGRRTIIGVAHYCVRLQSVLAVILARSCFRRGEGVTCLGGSNAYGHGSDAMYIFCCRREWDVFHSGNGIRGVSGGVANKVMLRGGA